MLGYSDKELMGKLRNGENKAFEYIFKYYYKGLCAYAYTFLKDHDSSEELVQDFFSGLWESQALREVEVSLKLYLYRSIHNKCINYLRSLAVSQRRLKQYMQYTQDEIELLNMDTESDLYERFFSDTFEADVHAAIETLAPQQKQVFTLSRFQQKSYAAIAHDLGISINSVKTQMSRALQKLRIVLTEKLGKHPLILFLLKIYQPAMPVCSR